MAASLQNAQPIPSAASHINPGGTFPANCSPLTGDIFSKNVATGKAIFSGTGLNDATSGGTYSATAVSTYTIVIDATGTPDTFKWKLGSGAYTPGVAITGAAQTLSNSVTITFAATTGHTLNDQWTISVGAVGPYYATASSPCTWTTFTGGGTGTHTAGNLTLNQIITGNGSADIKASGVVLGTMTDGNACTYTAAGTVLNCNTAAGTGTVTSSGPPTIHQWPNWTTATNLKGITITASKPVCSDANGEPGVCAGTEGVWLPLAGGTMTGNLLFTDNTLDIGASGATRPRTIYVGTSVITPALTASGLIKTTGPDGSQFEIAGAGLTDFTMNVGASGLYIGDKTNSKTPFVISPNSPNSLTIGTTTIAAVGPVTSDTSFSAPLSYFGFGATAPPAGPAIAVASTLSTSPRGILSMQFSTDTNGARVGFAKARGTVASPLIVATGDALGRLMFRGYDGTNYLEMGSIEVSAVGTVASTRVPTQIVFSTATDAAPSVLTTALTLKDDQTAVFPVTVTVNNAVIAGGTNTFAITNGTAGFSVGAGIVANFTGTFTDGKFCTYTAAGNVIACNSSGGSGLTVGTTTVTSGTGTRLMYETSGNVLGEVSGATSDGTKVTFASGDLLATLPHITTGIADANGNTMIGFTPTASPVDNLNIANAATAGHAVLVSVVGSDANIDLRFSSKGSGIIREVPGTDGTHAWVVNDAGINHGVIIADTTNKRVSIGSDSDPSTTLDVNGDTTSRGNTFIIGSVYVAAAPTVSNFSAAFGTNGLTAQSSFVFAIDSSSPSGNLTGDTFLTRRGAANWRLGKPDVASPVAQTLSVQGVVAGTADTAGALTTYTGSQSTGTGAGGGFVWQVSPAAASTATTQNNLVNAFGIAPSGTSNQWTYYGQKGNTNLFQTVSVLVSSSAGTTLTATNLIPAGSLVHGCTSRVTTAFGTSNGLTSISLGDGTTANLYADTAAITLNATTSSTNFLSTFSIKFYASATSVVVTGNGGTGFDATGGIRISCFVESMTGPTS